MTELEQLLAMFDRCGIAYQRFDPREGGTTIDVAPKRPNHLETVELYATEGPLRGEPWASTTYSFDGDGRLTHLHMSGD